MSKIHRVLRISLSGSSSWVKYAQACKAVENCASKWINDGQIKDLTLPESIKARAEQTAIRELSQEVLGSNEIPGLKFVPPSTTRYEPPREAYEEMQMPLGVRVCRWPRQSNRDANLFEVTQ